MQLFCTLFDQNYLSRGLALHQSLRRHSHDAHLIILCLDELTLSALQSLSLAGATLISIGDLEQWDPGLSAVRFGRKPVEYYFTCKPVLMQFCADRFPAVDRVTYLDSDLFYFSPPRALEQSYAECTVALTPHRFPPRLAERERFGKFNAGWVSTRCSGEGTRFLDWWRERCLEWCKLELQECRFGDQKYLDAVPRLFPGTAVIGHRGANLAPWNLDEVRIAASDAGVDVDTEALVFFHFHGLRRVVGRVYDTGLRSYGVPLRREVRQNIYGPYLESLSAAESMLAQFGATDPSVWRNPEYPHESLAMRVKRVVGLVASGTWMLSPRP